MNIEVSGGTLYISMKSGSYENIVVNGEAPTIYVTNKTLKDVSSSGSGDFTINGNLNTSDGFSVRNSGSSDFKSGVIKADSKDVTVSTSGSGDIDAGDFKAETGKASVAGSGDIRCHVERLSDRVRGSGDIHNKY